ncbi:ABC transporter permease [Nakamurella deserti]|uniref:ABC transporter permease n=1 Tax=Nakamurella deserti TaxID=2164074 RepID=UPI001F0BA2DD|nr:ABC transporter permease [Nakamurella deserti]
MSSPYDPNDRADGAVDPLEPDAVPLGTPAAGTDPHVPETERQMTSLVTLDTETAGPAVSAGAVTAAQSELRLVVRRFLRHRAAMVGLVVLVLIVLLAFTSIGWGPLPGWWKQSYLTFEPRLTNGGEPTLQLWPFSLGDHPFGQDTSGRDYFALAMRGMQQSIIIALLVGIVSTVIGTVVGALAGYYRGWVEGVLMRITDVLITIPLIAVAAVVVNKIGGGGVLLLGVFLGLLTWTGLARIVRGEFLSLREREFVDAARSVGASSPRIIFRHILPNTIGVITVSATLAISGAILLETALSFLGFGVKPPDTSLGLLVQINRQAIDARPYLFWWPAVFIVVISLAINFIGDGLRDAFDPKQTRSKA